MANAYDKPLKDEGQRDLIQGKPKTQNTHRTRQHTLELLCAAHPTVTVKSRAAPFSLPKKPPGEHPFPLR